jgi:hypothetical protein
MIFMVGNKNEAIPANSLAVSPLPFFALQRLYVALEGIYLHPINRFSECLLVVVGKGTKLLGSLWR